MLFNSLTFIIFFVSVVTVHFLLPHRFRWMLLLAASCVFYMAWNPSLIALIIFSCAFNHIYSHRIYRARSQKYKKRLLVVVLLVNFGLLFVFKYLTFINETFMYLFDAAGIPYKFPGFDIILPLGISFFTFQAVGYVTDVYRGELAPEKNFFKLVLFITFFPQLVAGPIERAASLLPQLFEKHRLEMKNITDGGKQMLFGFFKKVVIADRAAAVVNVVYGSPRRYTGLPLLIATFLFALQIYCDFSGYSEIALGSAKMLGIDLMKNFKAPYMSKSIREFWSRWHISLSAWFRDYLYIPLGGSRVKPARVYFNLITTFLVSGMWHGANWTFLIWGAVHGVCQAFGRLTQPLRSKLPRVPLFQTLFCFLIVTFAWVFFRAATVGDAFYILSSMFTGVEFNLTYLFDVLTGFGVGLFELAALAAMIILLFVVEFLSRNADIHDRLARAPSAARLVFYYALAASIMAFGVFDYAGQFIYFQF